MTGALRRSDAAALARLAAAPRGAEPAAPDRRTMRALEEYGRVRLSAHFFMRDFLYSEISAVHGIPNVPHDPELAIAAGRGLCENLLEPLRDIFGHVSVRSAYRCEAVNGYGNAHGMNCARNARGRARHIWDRRDEAGRTGATACVVVPWFVDSPGYRESGDWRPLAWFVHDRLPYSEMCFFPRNAAFNLTWRDRDPLREIRSYAAPRGLLTKPGRDNHEGDHSACYRGFPDARPGYGPAAARRGHAALL